MSFVCSAWKWKYFEVFSDLGICTYTYLDTLENGTQVKYEIHL